MLQVYPCHNNENCSNHHFLQNTTTLPVRIVTTNARNTKTVTSEASKQTSLVRAQYQVCCSNFCYWVLLPAPFTGIVVRLRRYGSLV
nr:CBM_HP1_G0000920.mRNA.1.CDS.1 [Saccharomyces cerevisiae]